MTHRLPQPGEKSPGKPSDAGQDKHCNDSHENGEVANDGSSGISFHRSPLLFDKGRRLVERAHGIDAKQVLPLELHVRRNAPARFPVENPLSSAAAIAEGARKLRGAAEPINEGCVVHDALNTTLMFGVNAACINELFTAGTIGAMHPSYVRLMDAAKKATAGTSGAISRPAHLARHMNESQQRVYNWQIRGVSKEGAIKAEGLFGVSASYVLEGTESQAPRSSVPPPLPPPDFADRREVTDTDWGLLQDVRLVMSDQELDELRARADRTRRIAQTQLEGFSAGAATNPRTGAPDRRRTVTDHAPERRHPGLWDQNTSLKKGSAS